MKRSVTDWEAAVCKHHGLPARACSIALWLARRMKPSRIVSVSEDVIAEAFGVSRTTVTNSIKHLKDSGLLVNVVAGRKGMTAVYQGMFPSSARIDLGAGNGLSDAAREALARASRSTPGSMDPRVEESAQCPDVVDTETTYMRPDVVDAIDGDSVHTSWTPRRSNHLTNESDQPWSGQEQAGDDGDDLSWIDDVIRDQVIPGEAVLSQGAKRPAPPEAQTIASPLVKAAFDDWMTERQQDVDQSVKPNRGGRAA